MKEMDVQGFKALALQCRFELSDEEAHDIKNEFDVLISQMRLLDKINTENDNRRYSTKIFIFIWKSIRRMEWNFR